MLHGQGDTCCAQTLCKLCASFIEGLKIFAYLYCTIPVAGIPHVCNGCRLYASISRSDSSLSFLRAPTECMADCPILVPPTKRSRTVVWKSWSLCTLQTLHVSSIIRATLRANVSCFWLPLFFHFIPGMFLSDR